MDNKYQSIVIPLYCNIDSQIRSCDLSLNLNSVGKHRSLRSSVQHGLEVAEGREEVDGRVLPRAQRRPDRDRHHRLLQVHDLFVQIATSNFKTSYFEKLSDKVNVIMALKV